MLLILCMQNLVLNISAYEASSSELTLVQQRSPVVKVRYFRLFSLGDTSFYLVTAIALYSAVGSFT